MRVYELSERESEGKPLYCNPLADDGSHLGIVKSQKGQHISFYTATTISLSLSSFRGSQNSVSETKMGLKMN